jgi:hypothetical protein
VSLGGAVTISATGTIVTQFSADAGIATPSGNNVNLLGTAAQGLSTSASGATVTFTNANWSTTQKGVGTLATNAEAIAGSVNDEAITPASLAAKLGTQTANGVALFEGSTSAMSVVAPGATSGIPLINQVAADPIYGTAVVAGGGTGATSFTAYSVITGGTTSTGALQNVSGVGTSGQVLTSNGAGTLPTWQTSSAGAGLLSVQGTLTNSQIKALHASPITVISAPGAGKVIVLEQVVGLLNYGGTNAFTASASQSISAYFGTSLSSAGGILADAFDITRTFSILRTQYIFTDLDISLATNNSVVLYNPIATEITGNAANNNTFTYNILYRILTIP